MKLCFCSLKNKNKTIFEKLIICFLTGLRRDAELLINKDAKVDVVGHRGRTALMCAAEKGMNTRLFYLNPLTCQIEHSFIGYDEIVQRILRMGVNINAVNADGLSAFLFAAKKGTQLLILENSICIYEFSYNYHHWIHRT